MSRKLAHSTNMCFAVSGIINVLVYCTCCRHMKDLMWLTAGVQVLSLYSNWLWLLLLLVCSYVVVLPVSCPYLCCRASSFTVSLCVLLVYLLHFAWDAKCIVVARICVSVCVSVCLSAAACLHYCTDLDITWGSGRGCPLVVHYWADLQSVHGLRCYGNTRNAWQSPAVIRQAHCTPHALRMHAPAIKSTHLLRVQRYLHRGRSISSILRGCCNANAKC